MDDEEAKILEEAYRTWVKSPSGVDLMRYLDENFSRSLEEAVDATDLQAKALLLQDASAYKTIRSYIDRISSR
jgi:hypothetical protein